VGSARAPVTEVVASEAAHLSVRKAAHLLGLAFRSTDSRFPSILSRIRNWTRSPTSLG
jgi:hypothetical protein